jgi:RNA polymerase sigma factor (sigma-70 family)
MSCANRLTREQEIQAFAAGNFDLLILSVLPLAYRVSIGIARSLSYDVDDARGLAAVAVCRSVRKFDPTRKYRLSTFIYRCVSSYVRREISRDQRKSPGLQLENDGEVLGRDSTPCLREEKKLYWLAVQKLPERERTILERRRAGHTFRKISADTGIGRSRVGQVCKQAINEIRSQLQPVM